MKKMKPANKNMAVEKPFITKYLLPVAGLLALVAVLSACLILLNNDQSGTEQPVSPLPARQLFSCAEEDVLSVTITPPKGDQYSLRCENGTFFLPEDAAFTVRSTLAEAILLNVRHIYIEDTILNTQETIVDLADFGLSPARCTASVMYRDGTAHTLYIGDQMQLGIPYRYFMWDDDPNLYAVSNDIYDAFSYHLSALRTVEQPVWDSTLWDKITITGQNARTLLETDAGWMLSVPFSYPLQKENMEGFLSSLENIRFAEYVGKSEELNLSLYGLDKPRLTLTLHQTPTQVSYLDEAGSETDTLLLPEEDIVLHLGDDIDEYFFYAEYLGIVYTATRFQLGFLFEQDISSLLDPTPLDIPITALQQLTVKEEGNSTVYDIRLVEQLTRTGDLVTDEMGNLLYDVYVSRNGETMDTDTFLTWYAQLQHLSAQGDIKSEFNPEMSDMQLFFKTADISRTVSFSRYDALNTAITVDGTTLVYTPSLTVSSLFPCP